MPGSLHKQVGRKNGNAWSVLKAAWHFVTVTVLQATENWNKKKMYLKLLLNLYSCKVKSLSLLVVLVPFLFWSRQVILNIYSQWQLHSCWWMENVKVIWVVLAGMKFVGFWPSLHIFKRKQYFIYFVRLGNFPFFAS